MRNEKKFFAVVVLSLSLVSISGCKKKDKAKAPTAPPDIVLLEPLPPPEPRPVSQEPKVAVNPPPVQPEAAKPKPKPRRANRKPSPAKPAVETNKPETEEPSAKPAEGEGEKDDNMLAKATPPRIVIQPGNTTEAGGSISPGESSHSEDAHRRQTTEQLMNSTEANLKAIKRVLNPNEQATLQQVRSFMTQAQAAINAQDLVRAHNLAMKAHLLSDELVR
jgi:hypothetical protein